MKISTGKGTKWLWGAACSIFLGLAGALVLPAAAEDEKPAGERVARMPESMGEVTLTFAPIVKKTAPAVVNVFASRKVEARASVFRDPFFNDFFRRHMPENIPRSRVENSLGSGVIVDAKGIVITNNHVIQGADAIRVALSGGEEYDARVLLRDERTDLAIIEMQDTDDKEFPVVPLGNSSATEVGDLVLAIGNPFAVGQTVTMGIISATSRTQVGVSDSSFFIQTDAAINPGNSGGALINTRGELIGVNTAIYSRSGGSIGIGFAIPSEMVSVVYASALAGSDRVIRPWLGATMQSLSADLAASLGLDRTQGAIVLAVAKEGPAERAGLASGDVILAIDGVPVQDPDALNYRLGTLGIGGKAELEVVRDEEKVSLTLPLEQVPGLDEFNPVSLSGNHVLSGISVVDLNQGIADDLRLKVTKGVAIVDIEGNAPLARFGLQKSDIILAFNGHNIEKVKDIEDRLGETNQNRRTRWQLVISRGGQILSVAGFGY